MSTIDLTNLEILDVYGVSRKPLNGFVSQNELTSLMIEEWIPYFECHKCGRYDYCKFSAPPHPANPDRSLDIQCGVTIAIMENYIRSSFPLLMECDEEQKQNFLDASFYFCEFINFAESSLGAYLDDDIVKFYGNKPSFFTIVINLRNQLNQIAKHLSSIPEFNAIKGYLLVEGETEKEFVKTLKESRLILFKDVLVESYEGKSNKKPAKLLLLVKIFQQSGYEIYIQGDKDSTDNDIFSQLIEKKIVKLENTLSFTHDFESSIPDYMLLEALNNLNYLTDVSIEEFKTIRKSFRNSVIECLEEVWEINVDSIKIPLAKEVAKLFIDKTPRKDEDFWDTELGKFINLIVIMP